MVKALAPRMPQGCPRVLLVIVVGSLLPLGALAQVPKQDPEATKNATAKTKPATKAEPDDDGPAPGEVDASKTKKVKSREIYKDPRAEKLLVNNFPELNRGKVANFKLDGPGNEPGLVKAMAGGGQLDPVELQRYVDYCVAELTNHKNIQAVIDPPPLPKELANPKLKPAEEKTRLSQKAVFLQNIADQARAIGRAADLLIEPLVIAREAKNTTFLTAYNRILLSTLPKLLDNHLLARNQAMLVLGLSGNPDAADLYIKQLNDPNQPIMVKLWAARGLSIATQEGRGELPNSQKSINAAKALADFLEREADAPWPIKLRALEALGALRQASIPLGKAEMATAAMKQLTDPQAAPDVRAWAAWALGMMRVNQQVPKFNYQLVAYAAGLAAADIGDKIVEVQSENNQEAVRLEALILYQIIPTFEGDSEVRESGLLRMPGASGDQKAIQAILGKIYDVTGASIKLTQAPKVRMDALRADLKDKVTALRTFLEKNKPKDLALVPGGPQFDLNGAQPRVAGNGGLAK